MSELAILGGSKTRTEPYPAWPVWDQRDIDAVTEVIKSGRWGGYPYPGPKTAELAKKFAEMQGGGYAVPMANGTVTMEVALRAAGIGWGDVGAVEVATRAPVPLLLAELIGDLAAEPIRPAVHPDDRGGDGPAGAIHGHQAVELRRERDRAAFQTCRKVAPESCSQASLLSLRQTLPRACSARQ